MKEKTETKIFRTVFIAIACIGILVVGFAFKAEAQVQDLNFRQWICELFKCQDFVDLAGAITAIKQDTETCLANQTALAEEFINVKGALATIDGKVDGIVAQFPITTEPDPATGATLARIEKRLSYFAKSEKSIWIELQPGDIADTLEAHVFIRGESLRQIAAWGFDLTFDETILEYQSTEKTELTEKWAMIDSNIVSPGLLRSGGVLGASTPIVGDVIGELVLINFQITGTAATTEVCLSVVIDGLADYSLAPACATAQLQ